MVMTYTSYTMPNGTTVVTIDDIRLEEYTVAQHHLDFRGSNCGDFGERYIFSDKGDRSRFEAFKAEVEQQTA